ncbi:cystatin-B-like [Pelodytes ibericus]
MEMPGGLGKVHPATPEVQAICDKIKVEAEKKSGKNFEIFKATEYKTQIVAGTNYFIKVRMGEDRYCFIRVHKALPHENEKLTFANFQCNKKQADVVSYF